MMKCFITFLAVLCMLSNAHSATLTVPEYRGASRVSSLPAQLSASKRISKTFLSWLITQKLEVKVTGNSIRYPKLVKGVISEGLSGYKFKIYFAGPGTVTPFAGIGTNSTIGAMVSAAEVRFASGSSYDTSLSFPLAGIWHLGAAAKVTVAYTPLHRLNPSLSAFLSATGENLRSVELGFNSGPDSIQESNDERIFESISSDGRTFLINPDLAACSTYGCIYAENQYSSSGVDCKVYAVRIADSELSLTYSNYACISVDASSAHFVIARIYSDGSFDTVRIDSSGTAVKSPALIGSSLSATDVLYDVAVSDTGTVAAIATTNSDVRRVYIDNQLTTATSFKASDICFSGSTLYVLSTSSDLYKITLGAAGSSAPNLVSHDVLDMSCSNTGAVAYLRKNGSSIEAHSTNTAVDSVLSSSSFVGKLYKIFTSANDATFVETMQ